MTEPLVSAHIVLPCPLIDRSRLEAFVEACLAQKVELIAIGGLGARELEDEIDWIIIGDGSDPFRFIATTAHDTLDDAREFAAIGQSEKPIQEIRF